MRTSPVSGPLRAQPGLVPQPEALDVTVAGRDPVVLAATGELTAATAGKLGAAIRALRHRAAPCVALDLHGVYFLDAAGARWLEAQQRDLQRRGSDLVVTRANRLVRRTLCFLGLHHLLALN